MLNKSLKDAKMEMSQWMGHEAVIFAAGGYEAVIIPEVGANVIVLKDNNRGLDILRTPDEELTFEQFKAKPQIYGIPILFPPNRIGDGRFTVGNRQYEFPINELQKNNHIHGFLKDVEWVVQEHKIIDDEDVLIKMRFVNDESSKFYRYLPHKFSAYLIYELSCKGLQQELEIINEDVEDLPVGVGFHTAINVPFHPESKDEDCYLIASIGERWELNERSLPTGNRISLSEEEQKFRNEGLHIFGKQRDDHYTIRPMVIGDKEFTGAIVEDRNKNIRLVYEMGEKYRHMMLWNSTGDKHLVCTEPQSWIINAPNVPLSDDITGFTLLKSGEKWSEFCKIWVEDM